MKKIVTFLIFPLLFFSLASCSKDSAEKQSTDNVLTIWTSEEEVRNAILPMANLFEQEYGAKIEINVLNKDLTGQFKTAAIAGKGPDIFAWAHDVIGELASSGFIEPIEMPAKLKESFLPVAINSFTYKGAIYGYPYDIEAVALIYNKKLVPVPPKTMEELVTMAKKLNNPAKKQYGFLYDINNLFFSFPLLSAGGGYIFKDKDGKLDVTDIGLANKGAIAGGTFIGELVKSGVIPSSTDYNIAMEKMKAGELGMTITGPWANAELTRAKIDYGVAPIPTLNGGTPKPFVGTHGFIIRRSSPNKQLAKEFIENYLVTKEGIMSLYKLDPRGPSRPDVIAELKNDAILQAFMKSAEVGIPMPNVPEMGAIWGAMGNAIKFIIDQKKSSEDALKEAEVQIKAALNVK